MDLFRSDPEARASLLTCLAGLPRMLVRAARWNFLRGGWLRPHLRRHRAFDRRALPPDTPIDVMVLFADHFEPARRFGDDAAVASVRSWCADYEALAGRHRDADGRPPQHTWFYRYDYPNPGCVRALSESAFRGFGEVEFHLHHGHDTHETLSRKFGEGVAWFNRFGAMLTAEPRPRPFFGYVAGNSALDNGAGDDALSGCDTELTALRDAGCYADFTFPALGSPAQPRKTNGIYYAAEDGRPKSYDRGSDVRAGGTPRGDLLMFQGPTSVDWPNGAFEDGAIENSSPPHPRRMAAWLSANVHVAGRPEWLFVKLHTHAMQNRAAFLSPAMGALFSAMEHWWNRPPFRLHYVTAREAFNIVKAAEAGRAGDPNHYRDFMIAPPANRRVACNVPWRLHGYSPEHVRLELLEPGDARIDFAEGPIRSIRGPVREVEATYRGGEVASLRVEGGEPIRIEPRHGADYFFGGGSVSGSAFTFSSPISTSMR
jgi:hypothetical protein